MLRELGYVEGKNIAFEYRYTEGKLDRIPALADELVRLKVDVLVASSTAEVLAFKNATKTLPIVFYLSSDPVADGLVDSLPRPWEQYHGIHYHFAGVVRQTAGVAQGNRFQAVPRCVAVGPTESELYATMERKPTAGARTESATSFIAGQQRR